MTGEWKDKVGGPRVEEELGVLRENWTWQDPELGKLSRKDSKPPSPGTWRIRPLRETR